MVFDHDVAHLRDGLVGAIGLRRKPEAIAAYHRARLQGAVAADYRAMTDFDARVKHRVVANLDVLADVHLRINLDVVANAGVLADVRKGPPVKVLAQHRRSRRKGGLFHTRAGQADQPLVLVEQNRKARVGVLDQNERGGHFLPKGQVFSHNDGTGLRGVEVGFVFGIGQKGDTARGGFLNAGQLAHRGPSVAPQGAAKQVGYLLHSKLHLIES